MASDEWGDRIPALVAVNDLLAAGVSADQIVEITGQAPVDPIRSVAWGNWLAPETAGLAHALLGLGVELRVAPGADDTIAVTVAALEEDGPLVIAAGATGFGPLLRRRPGLAWYGLHPHARPLPAGPAALPVLPGPTAPPNEEPAPAGPAAAPPVLDVVVTSPDAAPAVVPPPPPPAAKRVVAAPRPRKPRVVPEDPKPAAAPEVMGRSYSFSDEEQPDDLPRDVLAQAIRAVPMIPDLPDDVTWEKTFLELSTISGDIPRRYPGLEREEYRDLLAYWAALLRHLQDTAPEHRRANLDDVFGRLTRFSKEYQPGFVWGLTREHAPHSSSWYTDALRQYNALQQRLDSSFEEALEKGRKHQLQTLRKSVSQWRRKRDDPEAIRHVAEAVKRCYEKGIDKRDPEIARAVRDVVEAGHLGGREFRYLREAVAALPAEQPEAETAEEPAQFGVCDNPECQDLVASLNTTGLPVVAVAAAQCRVCANSNGRRAVRLLVERLRREGISRLLVVGGMVDQSQELDRLLEGTGIELRQVDGRKTPTRQKADRDLEWAEMLVIWPSGALHKVTEMFTNSRLRPARTFFVPKGSGLGGFSRALMEWLDAVPSGADEAAG